MNLETLEDFAMTLIEGSVEVSKHIDGGSQISVLGRCKYEEIPSFSKVYELFGPTKIAILAKPHFDGNWSIALVSIL